MIPKIIHYCWFGRNPLPPLALECIASWKKFLPDYEIWMWVEDGLEVSGNGLEVSDERLETSLSAVQSETLNSIHSTLTDIKVAHFDVNIIPYTAEAYKQKKYAFVSDYARFWIMYNYGGLYFDTDVEVIRPLDDIIDVCSARNSQASLTSNQCPLTFHHGFMGFELDPDGVNTPNKYAPRFCYAVNPGVGFGISKGHPFIKRMIDHYSNLTFELPPADISWYKTIVAYTTEMLCKYGLKNVSGMQTVSIPYEEHSSISTEHSIITVYPSEYFAPINVITGRLHITENTRTIHRYMGSWNVSQVSVNRLGVREIAQIIRHYLPECILILMNKIKRRRYKVRG